VLLAFLLPSLLFGCALNKGGVKIKRDIRINNSSVGQIVFKNDNSYAITCQDAALKNRIEKAISVARAKGKLLLRYEEMQGDKLVMFGDMIGPEDKNYPYALINEIGKTLNYPGSKDDVRFDTGTGD